MQLTDAAFDWQAGHNWRAETQFHSQQAFGIERRQSHRRGNAGAAAVFPVRASARDATHGEPSFIIITAPSWALREETSLFMFHHNKWKLVFLFCANLQLVTAIEGIACWSLTFPPNRRYRGDIRRIFAHSDDVDGAEREENTKIMFSTSSLSKWKEKAGQLVLLKFWCSFVYSVFIFLFVLLKTPRVSIARLFDGVN